MAAQAKGSGAMRKQTILAAIILAGLALTPGLAHAASVADTVWKVQASWSKHIFYWAFWENGRYQDTDGAVGAWTQDGDTVTLNADAGFVYHVTLHGETASGDVWQTDINKKAGTFKAWHVVPKKK